MSSELIKNITDASFEVDVLKSELPVLVDFWAPSHRPSIMMVAILNEIAEAYKGKLTFVKLNVDENPETPTMLGVRGIPMMKLFKDGSVVANQNGAVPRPQLESFIEESLKQN
ncbi:thioredoxin family protein [Pseudomonas sp. RA_105y_Pfl2_P56]|uniref:thioredoxin family protein n=1 Tax=Pseudomonas sp. RA_105y_Pfl2_P56 TaxID=3088701 RepID=UPI0030D7F53C